ncbi:dynamin family protein [Streptomyces sp. UNOC14_S4]|uniref:dynamin family protein n=1 Tax=Streptomyces sp. UNOC14_S4 TaxID=2872340 RepID=UPI001E43BDF9|nr:dynamin family protein [Streptomyces sp. UNOC14_S4]MCC3771122.1 dynamin family protein [Streptomyces sp. UNOC14_S4]
MDTHTDPRPADGPRPQAAVSPPAAEALTVTTDTVLTDTPPAAGPAQVADVGSAVPSWLREALVLAGEYRLDRIATALEALAAGRGRRLFRVAVVGEFNRGKSTVINRLLGRGLLPTGSLPVTRAPVVVRPAQDEVLCVIWPDGRRELRRLDTGDPWHGLTGATQDEGSEGTPEPSMTVTVTDDWLGGLDAELVDTPGVNSGSQEQFEQVRRTAAGSDAVLFVVSALSPLGITERRLLEEEVLCRHVPFTAVVVTMLDLLDADDRAGALHDLGQRLAGLASLPVLPAPAPGAGETELAALRELVEGFARRDKRTLWRDRQIAAQVADFCEAMAVIAGEAMAADRLSAGETEARAKEAQARLEHEEQQWEQLRIDLTARQLALTARLRDHVQEKRDGVIERLRWELERNADPRGWWEHDLPFRLRHELSLLAKESERTVLLPALTADAGWLDEAVADRSPEARPSWVPTGLKLTAEPEISGNVSDLSRTRLVTRLGAQGGAIVGYLIAATRQAPLPMIYGAGFSLLGGLLAEASIRAATEAQRKEVDAVLVRVIDESTMAFQRQAVEVLSEVYGEVFEQLRQSRIAWHDAWRTAAESGGRTDEDWPSLAHAATALAVRIRAGLQG